MELVVGLTVTGIALAGGYGALAAALDHRERLERVADEAARAATIRREVGAWIGGARLTVSDVGPVFRGLDGIRGGSPDDELMLLTNARTPLGRNTIVRLFVDRNDSTPERGLVAEFAEWRGTRTSRLELAPQVVALDIRYFSRVIAGTGWQSSWISTTLLPAGIELTLLTGPEDTLPPLLMTPIRVHLGSGR